MSGAGAGYSIFMSSSALRRMEAISQLRYHFLLTGMTYQGAQSVLVLLSISSYAFM